MTAAVADGSGEAFDKSWQGNCEMTVRKGVGKWSV